MGRKLGLDVDKVVAAAAEIADRDGLDTLTLASLASTLGVRSPSLYSHVDGLAGLRRELALHASSVLTAEIEACVEGSGDAAALTAVASQLRSFAKRHPGLYDSLLPSPSPEEDPELAAALAEPVEVVGSILVSMGVDTQAVIPLIRALRASVHGFIDLESRGGFGLPDDIDASFSTTINLAIEAIVNRSVSRPAV
jgi:AcrR family transcriptional regulator